MSKIIKCIDENKLLNKEIKNKIKEIIKLKGGNNPTDEQVLEAVKQFQKNVGREKQETINDLLKTNDAINKILTAIKNYPDSKLPISKVEDIIISMMTRDVWGTTNKLGLKNAEDKRNQFIYTMNSIYKNTVIKYESLKSDKKIEVELTIAELMDNKTPTTKDKKILELAKEFKKTLEETENSKLELLNREGIITEKNPDRWFTMNHSPERLITMGREGFINFIKNKIDPEKTMSPDGVKMSDIGEEQFLGKFYDSVVGLKEVDIFKNQGGKTILRNKYNQQKILVFKSATDELEYKKHLGETNSIILDLISDTQRQATDYSIASVFGSNPKYVLNVVMNKLKKEGLIKDTELTTIQDMFSFVTGEKDIITNPRLYSLFAGINNIVYSTILGGASLTTIATDPAAAATTFRQFGMTNNNVFVEYLKQHGKQLKGLFTSEEKILANKNAVSLDGYLNSQMAGSRFFDLDNNHIYNLNGYSDKELRSVNRYQKFEQGTQKLAATFFKISLQNRLQRLNKNNAISTVLNYYDVYSSFSLDEIKTKNNSLYKILVDNLNITNEEWDLVKTIKKSDTLNYEDLRNALSDIKYDSIVEKLNAGILKTQYLSVQEPSDRVRALGVRSNNSKGSVNSIGWKQVLFLKSFTAQATMNFMKRYSYEDNILHSTKHTLVNLTLSLAAGYVSLNLKALANGETFIDPSEMEPNNLFTLAVSSIAVSGGLGLLGDIVSQDYSEFSKDIVDLFVNPFIRKTSDTVKGAYSIGKDIVQGEEINDDAYGFMRKLYSSLPYNNLFYTKLLTYQLRDFLIQDIDPERHERIKKRKEEGLEKKGQDRIIFE